MKLVDLADIIIPSHHKKSEIGEEVLVVNQRYFARAGFTTACGNLEMIDDKNYLKNELKEFDVLLSGYGNMKILDKLQNATRYFMIKLYI